MPEKFYKRSKQTNEYYNLFDTVRILNVQQCAFYMDKGIELKDVYVSKDKNGKPILVFLFDKNDTKEAYDEWCRNHNLTREV